MRIANRLMAADGYMDLGMWVQAREELASIPSEFLEVVDALWLRQRLAFGEKAWTEALPICRKLCELAADLPDSWIACAYAAREVQDLALARDVAREGLKRFPNQPILLYNLACYQCLLGDLSEAKRLLERAFTLDNRLRVEARRDKDLAKIESAGA